MSTDDDTAGPFVGSADDLPAPAVRLWPLDVVVDMLSVSKRYVEELVATGELRRVRLGRRVLVRDDDLAAFIDEHTEGVA